MNPAAFRRLRFKDPQGGDVFIVPQLVTHIGPSLMSGCSFVLTTDPHVSFTVRGLPAEVDKAITDGGEPKPHSAIDGLWSLWICNACGTKNKQEKGYLPVLP